MAKEKDNKKSKNSAASNKQSDASAKNCSSQKSDTKKYPDYSSD